MFSGVHTVLTLPLHFLFVAEAMVQNFCTQFLLVLQSGTVPLTPNVNMSSEY
jgi:hypothetical protein